MTNEIRDVQSSFSHKSMAIEAQEPVSNTVHFAQNLGQQAVQRRVGRIFDIVLSQCQFLMLESPNQQRFVKIYQGISSQMEALCSIVQSLQVQSSNQEADLREALLQAQRQENRLCSLQRDIDSLNQALKFKGQALHDQQGSLIQAMSSLALEQSSLERDILDKDCGAAVMTVSGVLFTISTTAAGLCLGGPFGAVGGFLAGATTGKGAVTYIVNSKKALEQRLELRKQELQSVNASLDAVAREQRSVQNRFQQSLEEIDKVRRQVEAQGRRLQQLGQELVLLRGVQDGLCCIQERYRLLGSEILVMNTCRESGISTKEEVLAFMKQVKDLREKLAQILHVPVEQLLGGELERQESQTNLKMFYCIVGAILVCFFVSFFSGTPEDRW